MTWRDVPLPPGPTGINLWPASPPATTCWTGNLPDQIYPASSLTARTLTVTGVYVPVLQATVSPNVSFSKTITYQVGASFTQGNSEAFSTTLGLSADDWGSISAGLTQTTSSSLTLSASTTLTYECDLKSDQGEVSVTIWQLVYTYTVSGTLNFREMDGPMYLGGTVVSYSDTFSQWQYPSASTAAVRNAAGGNAPALDRLFAA